MMKYKIFSFVFLLCLISGCGTPQLHKVESVHVCASHICMEAAEKYTATQMLSGLQQLIAINYGQEIRLCESDPKSLECKSKDICFFTQGGPIPGMSCLKKLTLSSSKIEQKDSARIQFQNSLQANFIGVSAICADHESGITVRSTDEILWQDDTFYCNWMAVGNMAVTFSMALDSVDFDKGIIGGYWNFSATGTAWANSTGYGIFILPKTLQENLLNLKSKDINNP